MNMAKNVLIQCDHITKTYHDIDKGQELVAIDDLSLEIENGEFVMVLGPSGCGKTTLLNILAGFERTSGGKVLLENREIKGPGADRGVVFQEYALFPWLTLKQNVAYGLRERNVPSKQVQEITDHYLKMVGLNGFENRYPHELSGGMRQRAALARVLVNDPKVLLMDEPFAALDAQTRSVLQRELARLWAETRKTVFFITHSVEEAVLLGDRVLILSARPGRIKEVIPLELDRPRDPTSEAFNRYRRQIEELIAEESFAGKER